MGKVALLAEREDGAAQFSKESQGLCAQPGPCWSTAHEPLCPQSHETGAGQLWHSAAVQGRCWKLLPVLASPSPLCLEVSLSLVSFLCFPLSWGWTCPALIVHLPVEVHGMPQLGSTGKGRLVHGHPSHPRHAGVLPWLLNWGTEISRPYLLS